MFRIGDFSRFSRVSVKMLRHYDALGLLHPAFVDPQTHYRYYSAAQLPRLNRILALRDLGFSLDHVADLLEDERSPRKLKRMLERRRVEVAEQLEQDRQRAARLDAALRGIEDGRAAVPDVVVREVDAVRVASLRGRVAELDDAVQEMFEALEAEVAGVAARAAGPPLLVYHDRDYRETQADVEVAVPVRPDAKAAGRASVRTLPRIPRAACVVYSGDYEALGRVLAELLVWLEANRLTVAGPTREVYLQFGARHARALGLPPDYLADEVRDFVTEVQVPLSSELQSQRRTRAR